MADPTHFQVAEAFYAAREKYLDLPEDPDEIAQVLVAEGVRGYCGNAWHCALAEYALKDLDLPEGATVEILGDTFVISVDEHAIEHLWMLPPHLAKFADRFDQEAYPELVLPGRGPGIARII